jgi:hypothetical protein
MKKLTAPVVFLVLAMSSLQALAANVQVNFQNPDRYTDVDRFSDESTRAMKAIRETLASLGNRYLPSDANLRVDVMDIDLAGRLIPSARAGKDIRLLGGYANPASIRLHYLLEENGRVVAEKDETIHGLAYQRTISTRNSNEAFTNEKNMLEQWFREALAGQAPRSGR